MNEQQHNAKAMEEIKQLLGIPRIISRLEKKLSENGDTLVSCAQINGDHIKLGSPLFLKGPAYWHGIHVQNKEGKESMLTRVSDYLERGAKYK